MIRLLIACLVRAVPLLGLQTGAEQSEKPAAVPEFRHHFVTTDLPSRNGQGDYGLTALADLDGDKRLGGHELQVGDVDGDGDIHIVSKPWSAAATNGIGGRMHVDFLENRLRVRPKKR